MANWWVVGVGRRFVVLVAVGVLGLVGAIAAGSVPSLDVSPSTLPSATKGQSYAQTMTAAGGTEPYSFSSDDLPAWLTLAGSGALTGTAPTDDNPLCFSFTIKATDSSSGMGSRLYTLPIDDAAVKTPRRKKRNE